MQKKDEEVKEGGVIWRRKIGITGRVCPELNGACTRTDNTVLTFMSHPH